jgi:hypothetical protein
MPNKAVGSTLPQAIDYDQQLLNPCFLKGFRSSFHKLLIQSNRNLLYYRVHWTVFHEIWQGSMDMSVYQGAEECSSNRVGFFSDYTANNLAK